MTNQVPNTGQVTLLLAAAGMMAAAAGVSVARIRYDRPGLKATAAACGWGGVGLGLVVLFWHAAGRRGWLPLEDNFDALAWLGVMLAGCVLYVQHRRPVGGLDWFILPIAAVLLAAAAFFGTTEHREYRETAWSVVHRVCAYGGALAFAIAGAAGAMYLVQNSRLRSKRAIPAGPNLGSLERLESVAQMAVTLGWPLFTIGLITGIVWGLHLHARGGSGVAEFLNAKVLLAVGVWVVYALALHTPINPSFRGRKAAALSLIGFLLMVGAVIAVQFMPGGK